MTEVPLRREVFGRATRDIFALSIRALETKPSRFLMISIHGAGSGARRAGGGDRLRRIGEIGFKRHTAHQHADHSATDDARSSGSERCLELSELRVELILLRLLPRELLLEGRLGRHRRRGDHSPIALLPDLEGFLLGLRLREKSESLERANMSASSLLRSATTQHDITKPFLPPPPLCLTVTMWWHSGIVRLSASCENTQMPLASESARTTITHSYR